jgi:hypothetical protein
MNFWDKDLYRRFDLDFSDLTSSTILDVGFHPDAREGGFGIDYKKDGKSYRIVLGFTELGMWRYWQGEIGQPSKRDKIKGRIKEFIENCTIDEIRDDPLRLRYVFVSDGRDALSLSVRELKYFPELMGMFGKALTEDDIPEIWTKLVMITIE